MANTTTLRQAALNAADNGYLLALCDKDGRYISPNVHNDIDELDEFNKATVDSQGRILAPNALNGLTVIHYNVEPEEGLEYTTQEFNEFIRTLR